jgi:hypothetical protein
MVRRTTIRKRMRAKLREVKQQLRKRMHDPVRQTGRWLKSVVQGYFNYYAVPGNLVVAGVRSAGSHGHAPSLWLSDGFLNRVRSIPFLMHASPLLIRDKNRMR